MPDPCTLHVQIRQTWTGPAPIVVHATYTVSDLARLWSLYARRKN